MRKLFALGMALVLLASCDLIPQRTITACADPNNLPFSNQAARGSKISSPT